ncbi:MAG TPA: FHA domain-containing protein, partial [Gemmataceae bacterium]|nr:FHA domain-containing protein [Gemmataceae bacterium]
MQIIITRQGREEKKDFGEALVIGRSVPSAPVDLDLTPDTAVSRRHARIWLEGGQHWIEDLNSTAGTLVNGVPIKGQGKRLLRSGDLIIVGENALRVSPSESPAPDGAAAAAPTPSAGAAMVEICPPAVGDVPPTRDHGGEQPRVEIARVLDADASAVLPPGTGPEETARRLHLLYRMSREFGAEKSLEAFTRLVVERLMEVFPKATRGSFALYDRASNELLLKAGTSPGELGLSETLARRAMAEERGFIWFRAAESEDFRLHTDAGTEESVMSCSMQHRDFRCGMYAPLLWQGQALGVLCVDSPAHTGLFKEDDLRLMLAVTQS